MYIRNSGVAQAPLSMLETMKTILTNPPQNDLRLVGREALPPMLWVPLSNHGYMVTLAQ